MRYIADLHVHSHFSRATSRDLDLENLNLWGHLKGIQLLATGDFTHSGWFAELEEKLEKAEEGLYVLKDKYFKELKHLVPSSCNAQVRFVLSTEISSIYKKHGKTRKVHNIILVPDLKIAMMINRVLKRLGNLDSDGRPILGIDSRDLLKIVLDISENTIFIPAHIWTPWFSVLGSNSGFDSIDECFDEYTKYIYAVETGLSSDPKMNWRLSSLDRFTLVSNSDAHSPSKIAREANIFDCELSFEGMKEAIRTKKGFMGTIEFFPEEGKYHFDGHRKCSVRMDPSETLASGGICPVCKTPVTVGVMNRVEQLADRKRGEKPEGAPPYFSLLSLSEVIADVYKTGISSRRVQEEYRRLIERIGPEVEILMNHDLENIEREGGALIAEGIRRMREGNVHIAPGYDGMFGEIHIFTDDERKLLSGQGLLIRTSPSSNFNKLESKRWDFNKKDERVVEMDTLVCPPSLFKKWAHTDGLNPSQKEAVVHKRGPLIIVAGPGTGKTRTLTHRIAYMIKNSIARPDQILALTFTRKAAQEMRNRLSSILVDPSIIIPITIDTFHAICYKILKKESGKMGKGEGFFLINETERYIILRLIAEEFEMEATESTLKKILHRISISKQHLLSPEEVMKEDEGLANLYKAYERKLASFNGIDLDDLIFRVVKIFETEPILLSNYRNRFPFLFVDEYQDINYAQYRLIRLLSPEGDGLCVIGDPDQAIYGFRGADRTFFMRFKEDYPDATLIHLDRNYRSTETIIKTALCIIKEKGQCENRYFWSGIEGDPKIFLCELSDEKQEAEFISREIDKLVGGIDHRAIERNRGEGSLQGGERSFGDFAVLYRIHAMARPIEEKFLEVGIPFQTIGERAMVEEDGIKEITLCLGLLLEGREETSLIQILSNYDRFGIEKESVLNLIKCCRQRGLSLIRGIASFDEISSCLPGSSNYAMRELIKSILSFRKKAINLSVCDQIRMAINELPVDRLIKGISMEDKYSHDERIRWLIEEASRFGYDLEGFLSSIAMMTSVDLHDQKGEKVSLLTLHASKGTEFPVIFIAGCEEGIIPYLQSSQDEGLDEERRLFYVGITRAMERLYICYVRKRWLFGKLRYCNPSPFLDSIEEELREAVNFSSRRKKGDGKEKRQLSLFFK